MPDPWLQDPDVTLYHGDVLATLRELPAESVDCVVTSPPYWGLRDYGTPGQLGLEPTPEQYVERMVEVFREVRRVLAAHGTVWVNLGDSFASKPAGSNGFHDGRANREERTSGGVPIGLKPKDLVGIPWRVARALQEPYYTGKIRDERDRIWLAATVEAEGCLFIHKRKAGQSNGQGYERKNDSYGAGLEVASTDRAIVEKCMAITGLGSICEQTPTQNDRRKQTIYRWNLRSNICREVIRELYPHFVAKHHEARLLLGCPSSGEKAAKAHESLKAIHQGYPPTIDFAPPETLFEPGWYLRSDIVWFKCNPMPESVTDRPTKAHEYVFLLTKKPRYYFDAEAVREPHKIDGRRVTTVAGSNGSIQHRDGERWPNGGRNIRSVWEISTQPYPEAHFATFPEELARRCIAAGCPEQVCRVCGKARERVVEITHQVRGDGGCSPAHADLKGYSITSVMRTNALPRRIDTGFTDCGCIDNKRYSEEQCVRCGWVMGSQPLNCNNDDTPHRFPSQDKYRPGIVLDPFMGSGTVAFVARKLGRHAIGIDLSESYLELAAKRLQQQSLFATEGAA